MVINYALLGSRIASRRKQLQLTQDGLSEKAGLTPKFISNIETAHSKPSIESIMKLCAALDVPPNYLLMGTPGKAEASKLEELNRLISSCDGKQLSKIIEYVQFLTNR